MRHERFVTDKREKPFYEGENIFRKHKSQPSVGSDMTLCDEAHCIKS